MLIQCICFSEATVKFLYDSLAAATGGVILTFILFALNEWVFRKKNITGEWSVVEIVKTSSIKDDFNGIVLKFKFHLLLKGYEIEGSGEKISETPLGKTEYFYEHDKRVTVTISGYLERKFLSKSKIFMHVIEDGRKRESRTSFILSFEDKNKMKGDFISTAADSNGSVTMKRTIF